MDVDVLQLFISAWPPAFVQGISWDLILRGLGFRGPILPPAKNLLALDYAQARFNFGLFLAYLALFG